EHYEKVLVEKIIPVYGQPFDHLQALGGTTATSIGALAALADFPSPPSSVAAPAPVQQHLTSTSSIGEALAPAAPPSPVGRQRAAKSSETTAIREAAKKAGYSD